MVPCPTLWPVTPPPIGYDASIELPVPFTLLFGVIRPLPMGYHVGCRTVWLLIHTYPPLQSSVPVTIAAVS